MAKELGEIGKAVGSHRNRMVPRVTHEMKTTDSYPEALTPTY